jgi:hypothetical protein
VLRHATHYALCGGEFNPDAPPKSRWSKSVDHIIPFSQLAHYDPAERHRLSVDPSNMRPAHLICNSKRGAHSVRGVAAVDPVSVEPPPWRGKWMNPITGHRWSRDWYGNNDLNPNWDGVER